MKQNLPKFSVFGHAFRSKSNHIFHRNNVRCYSRRSLSHSDKLLVTMEYNDMATAQTEQTNFLPDPIHSSEMASLPEEETNPPIRRSGRERRATTVTIDGFAVKVNNQYDLETGELSVFDSELGEGLYAPVAVTKTPPPPRKKPVEPRAPREHSSAELARQKQNAEVEAQLRELDKRRQTWLRRHLTQLEPWIPAKAAQSLRDGSSTEAAELLPAVEMEQQPKLVRASMREYQLCGTSFMSRMVGNGVGCILADEMGLGKTLQSIALIAWLKLELKKPGPCLVVVPLSVLSSWQAEFKRWCPTLKVSRAHTRFRARTVHPRNIL
ncbi:hypothetical protein CYMTET_22903 [Cymbomonas tetramitiformis]|uniref:Helicase ATP-binding domain-containing protein n=1 Tax=Cymbomonas tetramitiformis TaxID=36881 RepID=A0AAE0FZC6_9CHLO|nr:hypothetical protein CYMTET_22903 [Cymbomonas tetramitiformis]